MRRKSITGTLLMLLLAGLLTGCGGAERPYAALDQAVEARRRGDTKLYDDTVNGTYKIGPPDELKITVRDNPDLTTIGVVRPDGYITFPYSTDLNDVYAEGLTPRELADSLTEKLKVYLKDVHVMVQVTNFQSKKIYVFGEVGSRQPQQVFTGNISVLDAVGKAGGVTYRGKPSKVLVVRGKPDNPQVFVVNMKAITLNGDSSQNIMLQADDVVYVPPNAFAWLGYQIDNLLFPFRGLLTGFYQVQVANR